MDGTTNREHGLQADSLGFLVGQRRIERITANIAQDTQEMVRLLRGMLQDRVLNPPDNQVQGLAAAIALSQRQATIDIVAAIRESSTNTQRLPIATRPTVDVGGSGAAAVGQVDTLPPVSTRPTVDVRSDADLPRNDVPPITDTNTPTPDTPDSSDSTPDAAAGTNPPPSVRTDYVRDARGRFVPRNRAGDADGAGGDDATAENTDGRVNNGRRRGANGRFEGNGDSKSWFDKFKTAVSGGVSTGMADTQGIDPTVDAINELGGLLSPMKKAAGFAFKPISMLMKRNKRSEPLPADQERHNREERRFWGRLVDAVRAQGNGNANWAGKLGGLVIAGAMAALRRIPWVAAGILAWEAGQAAGGKVNEALEDTTVGDAIGELSTVVAAAAGSQEAADALNTVPDGQSATNGDGSSNVGKMGAWNRFGNWVGRTLVQKPLNWANEALGGSPDYFTDSSATGAGGRAAGNQTAVSGIRGFTPEKAKSIQAVAQRIGVEPNDLASIISFETSGTFSPSIKNPNSSGTGLIQFMERTAKGLGTTTKDLAAMSFDDQMQYVERYFKGRGFDGTKKRSLADAYTAVTGYGYREGTKEYDLNKVWDTNDDGYISKGEAVQNPKFKAHQRQYFKPPVMPAKVPETSKPPEIQPAPAVTMPAPAPASNTQSMIRPAAQVMSLPISASSARQAPNLPAMQPMPKIREPISSPAPQVVTIAQSADTIAQNVGDRAIAHAVTGGLGMRGWDQG